jgi:hypothetical protein
LPTLPSLNVSDEQAARILEAFADSVHPDTGQPLTPQEAYRRWLRDRLMGHVLTEEAIRLDADHAEVKREALDELAASLAAPVEPAASS